jgi:hypothetical protein
MRPPARSGLAPWAREEEGPRHLDAEEREWCLPNVADPTAFDHPAPGPLGSAASGRTKLAPLGRIGGPAGPTARRVAGGAPVADESLPATHTPPQVDARARARKTKTAAELGMREPPRAPSAPTAHQQKKRLRHPTYEVEVENGNGNEQLERTPTPAPVQGRTPMKGRESYSGRGLFDELEEGLMESILDAEAEPSPR